MPDTKFTPGPLHADDRNVVDAQGKVVAICAWSGFGGLSVARANAVRFAAVDDLLEALTRIIRIRPSCDNPVYTDQSAHNSETCRWCIARLAIAKALGREVPA